MVVASCILITFLMLHITHTFDVDYYFSSPLRTKEINCSGIRTVFCQLRCKTLSSICLKDECYCLSVTSPNSKNNTKSDMRLPDRYTDEDFEDEEHSHSAYEEPEADFIQLRPMLRHHIAHFCPNLDVARQCIKKCMAIGKPAFCGKDHVCYCGHKYTHGEDDPKSNAKDIYAQFKDLYKKYFGIDNNDNLSV